MKRITAFILAAMLLCMLSVCSFADEVNFSAEETREMSAYMNYGRYIIEDNVLFGTAFDKGGPYPSLVRSEIAAGVTPQIGVYTVLDRHVNANYLTSVGDSLYYIRIDRDKEENACSIARTDKNGSGTVLLTKECEKLDYMRISGDKIYFTDEEAHFCSMDMNGKDKETIINSPVYYPYFIDSDRIIYQADGDGETLHIYVVSENKDYLVTENAAYCPIVAENYLFFVQSVSGKNYLCRIDLSSQTALSNLGFKIEQAYAPTGGAFWIEDGMICGVNSSSVSLKDWKNFADGADRGVSKAWYYFDDEYKIYADTVNYIGGDVFISELYIAAKDAVSGAGMFRHVY